MEFNNTGNFNVSLANMSYKTADINNLNKINNLAEKYDEKGEDLGSKSGDSLSKSTINNNQSDTDAINNIELSDMDGNIIINCDNYIYSLNEIFNNPLHPYTQALFSAVPVPDPDVKMNRIILSGDIPSPANPPKGCKFHTRCSKCMKVCSLVEPAYIEQSPNHFVSCHLYNQYILDNSKSFDEIYDKVNELKETLKQEQAKAKKEQDKDIIKSIQEEIKELENKALEI